MSRVWIRLSLSCNHLGALFIHSILGRGPRSASSTSPSLPSPPGYPSSGLSPPGSSPPGWVASLGSSLPWDASGKERGGSWGAPSGPTLLPSLCPHFLPDPNSFFRENAVLLLPGAKAWGWGGIVFLPRVVSGLGSSIVIGTVKSPGLPSPLPLPLGLDLCLTSVHSPWSSIRLLKKMKQKEISFTYPPSLNNPLLLQ